MTTDPIADDLLWTQPACEPCAEYRMPGRVAYRVVHPAPETCCICGTNTTSGVFIRVNPAGVRYPTHRRPL